MKLGQGDNILTTRSSGWNGKGQTDSKCAALSGVAFDEDIAMMLFDNGMRNGKP